MLVLPALLIADLHIAGELFAISTLHGYSESEVIGNWRLAIGYWCSAARISVVLDYAYSDSSTYHRRQIRRKYSELDNIQFSEQHRYRSDSTCVLSAHQYRIGDGISTCDVDDTTQGKPYAARTFYRSMAITIEL